MAHLNIAPTLSLPLEAVTQTFAIIAKRGAGKTFTALVLAEEFLGAGAQVVIADPVGVCWGLRAAANGKDPGLPIIVMGGDHGDVPLEAAAGRVVADFVVERQQSVILDLSLLRKGDQVRFMTDFAETLYHRNRAPLHLILDESDAFAPQRPLHGQERMLGAVQDLVRRGRARGIGVTLVTQRAAVLSKDVLTQVEVLVALRTIAPQDREAIDAWIQAHDAHGQRAEFMASLASLPIGTAWFWSPGWLDVFRRVAIRPRRTFDSSATPKVGQRAPAPKSLAPVDLEALKAQIAATIQKAKQEDPRALRQQVAELEAELRKKNLRPAQEKLARIEVPVLKEGQLKRVEALMARVEGVQERLAAVLGEAVRGVWDLRQAVRTAAPARPASTPEPRREAPEPAHRPMYPGEGSGDLTGPQRKLLTALAQHGDRSTTALALLTGYAHTGGAFRNPLSSLRSLGYADGRETVRITDAGLRALGSWDPLPTGSALLAWWIGHLPGPESKLLRAAADAYPKAISVEDLARATGYEATGGAFRNPLSRLRTLSLVSGRAEVRAAEELFG